MKLHHLFGLAVLAALSACDNNSTTGTSDTPTGTPVATPTTSTMPTPTPTPQPLQGGTTSP